MSKKLSMAALPQKQKNEQTSIPEKNKSPKGKEEPVEHEIDKTLEDSFPASDPPGNY